MKLKEQKKLGILYLVLGAVLFLVGLLTDAGEKMNWLSSFGSAIAVVGAARLLRVYRLTRDPDKAADYDRRAHGVCGKQGAFYGALHLHLRTARRSSRRYFDL